MAATRTYYRDSKGRWAGSSGGRAETGKSGGFANAAHRSRVASAARNGRTAPRPGRGSANPMQPGQRLSRANAGARARHVFRSGRNKAARAGRSPLAATAKQLTTAAVIGGMFSKKESTRNAAFAAFAVGTTYANVRAIHAANKTKAAQKAAVQRRASERSALKARAATGTRIN